MFTVVVAVAVLLAIGLALGRAPLFRGLVVVLALFLFLPMAAAWLALLATVDVERLLRFQGIELGAAARAALFVLPPLLCSGWLLLWMRRRAWPRFLWRLAERPATLSLPGILLVQAGVVLVCIGGGNLVASWRQRQAEFAWSGIGQSFSTLANRYPKAPTNAAGLELQRLSAALGIRVGRDSDEAGLQGKGIHGRVQSAVSAYVFQEKARSLGPTAAPPLEVRAWLAMSTAGLGAIERQLSSGGPIVWETDIDQWLPYPLAGLRDVHSALVAAAFDASVAGRTAEAGRSLEAAWALTSSLRERPDTSARLLALFQDRCSLGALRALGPASDEWPARLEVLNDAAGPLGALAVESRSFLEDARGPRTTLRGMYLESNWALSLLGDHPQRLPGAVFLIVSGGRVEMGAVSGAMDAERARARSRFYRLVQGPLERPYLRLCAADYASAVQAAYSKVLHDPEPCVPVPLPPPEAPERLAPWSLVGDGAVSVDHLAHTVSLLRAEVELTRHVLRARSLRAADPGHAWPRELPGLESVACRGRRWLYEVSPDGRSASVRLDQNPFGEREATVEFHMREQ